MSRLNSNAAGGEYATRFQRGPDAINYAKKFLDKGMSYHAAARASGVNELTLREMLTRKPAPVVVLNVVKAQSQSTKAKRKRRPGGQDHGLCADGTLAVIAEVAKRGGYTVKDMTGCRMNRCISRVRQVAYYEVRRQRPHLSFPEIGRIFNRDHTTALYGIAKVEDALAWADILIWAGNPLGQLELFREAA